MQEDVLQGLLSKSTTALIPTDTSGNRIGIRTVLPSPCAAACPAGVNVKGYVGLIAAGRFRDALELVRQGNPLPGICGRVCHHPCEAQCKRGEVDDPVAIRWLKRFVADYELEAGRHKHEPLPRTRKEKVAIVGSGPAGLTAANDLVRLGYGVTVFEAHSEPGGMLTSALPVYRLPREIIRTEIDAIVELGVEIRTNTRIGANLSLDELFRKAGYGAIFIAVGAQVSRQMDISGEVGEGVTDCLTFLNRVNAGDRSLPGRRVAIVGGGHSALDCAQTAIRLGAEDVHVVYRRSPAEMPADVQDVKEAEGEGVRFSYPTSPFQIRRASGQVVGLECLKNQLGLKDASGRRRPEPIAGSEFEIPVDVVISAVGQQVDSSDLIDNSGLELSQSATILADEHTLSTGVPGVFAGGDSVTGPAMAIDAIGQGHKAARAIHRYLLGEALTVNEFFGPSRVEFEMNAAPVKKEHRLPMPRLQGQLRPDHFDEIVQGFSVDAAVKEASRCLRCGPCAECTICLPDCVKHHTLLSIAPTEGNVPPLLLRSRKDQNGFSKENLPNLWRFQNGSVELAGTDVQMHPTASTVTEAFCRGCGTCVTVCDYGAARLFERDHGIPTARIDPTLCKGCGVCASVCPSSAIVAGVFTDQWMENQLKAESISSKVVVFSCHWNAAMTGERIGLHLKRDPLDLRCIQVLCSGRIHTSFILKAFELGAAEVVFLRCPPEQCHYGFGSRIAKENFGRAQELIHLLGIAPDRLRESCPKICEVSKSWSNDDPSFEKQG